MRRREYLQISEERLRSICSSDQMEAIRKDAVAVVRNELDKPNPIVNDDESQSETDSADEMEVFTDGDEGIIMLSQSSPASPGRGRMRLALGLYIL